MENDWVEIRARGPEATKDLASSALIGAGSPGVVEGGFTEPPEPVLISVSSWDEGDEGGGGVEEAPEPGPDAEARLTAYLPADDLSMVPSLREELKTLGWTFRKSAYSGGDWQRKWREGIRPVRVRARGRGVLVKPTWSGAAARPDEVEVVLDPGLAFGTGSHETTRMCLKAMLMLFTGVIKPEKTTVLDVGSGTGVLAIAAVKLGSGKVTAVELDPVAREVTRENARGNHTPVTVSSKKAEDVSGTFTLVLANILSGELKRLAPSLVKKVRRAGYLVLSGILTGEAEEVSSVYENLGLTPFETFAIGEWTTLVFSKPSSVKSPRP